MMFEALRSGALRSGALRSDRGAGSVVTVGLIGGIVAVTALSIPLYIGLATRQALAGAADAAALAAADVAVGIGPGFPCEVAAGLAAATAAALADCEVDGLVVTVVVSRWILGIPVSARSTAGPPPDSAD